MFQIVSRHPSCSFSISPKKPAKKSKQGYFPSVLPKFAFLKVNSIRVLKFLK
jgi:hypothetical protein